MTESKAAFWLAHSMIGANKYNKLVNGTVTPLQIWKQFRSQPRLKAFLGDRHYATLNETYSEDWIESRLTELKKRGIGVMTRFGKKMPECLLQSEVCPPAVLYYKGDPTLLQTGCLAVVGTRHSSRYGAEAVKALVPELVRGGLTIVSGLATGIDAFALQAALDCGGRPISVLASGLEKPSPAANVKLFETVCQRGVALSEYPPEYDAQKFYYPERNRLLSGLSYGVLVVEAPERSGALITAEHAVEQGREVFVVPGAITNASCKGSNALLREGATVVLSADDVLSQLGFRELEQEEKPAVAVSDDLKPIVEALREGEKHFDELCDVLRCKPFELSPKLTMLELSDAIVKLPNNRFALKQ